MRQQIIIPAVLAGIVILGAWGFAKNDPEPVSPQPVGQPMGQPSGRQAPGFELAEVISGDTISLEDYRGKVVLVDFWATWCRPCRMEIPHFVDLRNELGDQGFEIIGISIDRKPWVVKPFVEQWNINYPVVIDSGPVSMAFGGVRSIPTAFLIDREGNIVERFVGYRQKIVFEQAIKRVMGQG